MIEKAVAIPGQERFAAIRAVQDAFQFRLFARQMQGIPREARIFTKTGNDDPFTVLGGEMLAVNDAIMHLIAQLLTLNPGSQRMAKKNVSVLNASHLFMWKIQNQQKLYEVTYGNKIGISRTET